MHSLTYKLAAIFLAIALIPLGIGIVAVLALQNAETSLKYNDKALHDLAGLFRSVDATIAENVRLQSNAQSAVTAIGAAQDEMYGALESMNETMLPRTFAVAQICFGITDITAAERAILLALNMRHLDEDELRATMEAQTANIDEAMEEIEDGRRKYLARPGGENERAAWDAFERSLDEWLDNHRDFMAEIANLEDLVEDLVRGGPLFASASRKAYDTAFVRGKAARQAGEEATTALNHAIAAGAEQSARDALGAQMRSRDLVRELDRETAAVAAMAGDVRAQVEAARSATLSVSARAAGDLQLTTRRFWYMIVFSAIGVAGAVVTGLVLSWRISGPVRKMAVHMSRLAEGDLTGDVAESERIRKDEVGQLARSLQNMIDSTREEIAMADAMAKGDYTRMIAPRSDRDQLGRALATMLQVTNDTLAGVSRAVGRVGDGAATVSAASRSLTEGSLTSASALEEISRTVSHVDYQAKDNADHARQANTLATSSRDAAKRGYGAVMELVLAMGEIQEAGKRIASVAKLIDDIAFQTNLLALNAAVEAARAGRQGKGFSVVADEVRNLSGRSAKAAQETGEMVLAMTERVETGVQLAKRTDSEFKSIVDATAQVAQLFDEITAASNAQSVAVAQISQSLNQIDDVIQENAANANGTAASAQALSGQAQELRNMVSRFRLDASVVAGFDEAPHPDIGPPTRQLDHRRSDSKLLGPPSEDLFGSGHER
jgi:methyl-accepting chemotaxis protein